MATPSRRTAPLRQSVTALMRNPLGEAYGRVRELSGAGCSIELPGRAPFERDSKVLIELRNVLLIEPLQTVGVVRELPGEDGVLLGVEFDAPEDVAAELPSALVSAFNRRRAPRMDVGDVVEVMLDDPLSDDDAGSGSLALLLNVSVDGVALRVDPHLARDLRVDTPLELGFSLPDVRDPFRLHGTVRSTWPEGDCVGCGIQFDPRSSGFKEQRARLRAAVVRRMDQLRATRRHSTR